MTEPYARLEKFLNGVQYPTTKANLVTYAEQYGVEQQVTNKLVELPERKFDTPADVLRDLGLERGSEAEVHTDLHVRSTNYNGNIPQGGKGEQV